MFQFIILVPPPPHKFPPFRGAAFGAFFQNRLMKCSSTAAGMLLLERRPVAAPDLVVTRFVDETVFQEQRLPLYGD